MKLRALRMANVRRFGNEGVGIEQITDGLNVFAAPNEAGKSTLFDALHALLFVKFKSKAAPVRSLKPYAGGSPRISVDVEYRDGSYRIEKQFLGGPFARVIDLQTDREIARADEAQQWIDRMIGADGKAGGPTGLLWVRQGESSNLAQGSKVRAQALNSVIEEEVTTLTGGERARRVIERCTVELGRMVTPTGKPKANGAYELAVRKAEKLAANHLDLRAQMEKARDALDERHLKQLQLRELTDPDGEREEEERLGAARDARATAERHEANIENAEKQAKLATIAEEAAKEKLEAFAENCAEARKIQDRLGELEVLLPDRRAAAKAASQEHDRLQTAVRTAEAKCKKAKNLLETAGKAEKARQAAKRHGKLSQHLALAEEAERHAREKRAAAKALGVEQADVRELERLSRKVEKAENVLHAASTRLRMNYEPDCSARARIGSEVLKHGVELRLEQPAAVAIDGVGSLSVTPGSPDSGTDARRRLDSAHDALNKKLAQLNCETTEIARQRRDERADLLRDAELDESVVQIHAPEGVEALRTDVERLKKMLTVDMDEDVPDIATAQKGLDQAETNERKARGDWEGAIEAKASSSSDRQQLESDIQAMGRAYKRERERTGLPPEAWADRQAELETDYQAKRREALGLEKGLHALREKAISLEFASAQLTRLTKAKENRHQAIGELEKRIAVLVDRIERAAQEGVEEAVSEVSGQLEAAQTRTAIYEAEIAALRRLRDAVEDEVSSLKERYLEPVNKEIRPLLGLLYKDAQLDFDGDKLMPQKLTRAGVSEDINALSGGTKEQIAILTRLAFARLLAKSGHTPPIILDDALIFSDDDRIQKMFTALNAQASDLQMIVLSCRQRAFRDLGGTVLRLEPASGAG